MKKDDLLSELRAGTRETLREKARAIADELMKLRFRRLNGSATKTSLFKTLRRDLARVMTVLNEKEGQAAQQ